MKTWALPVALVVFVMFGSFVVWEIEGMPMGTAGNPASMTNVPVQRLPSAPYVPNTPYIPTTPNPSSTMPNSAPYVHFTVNGSVDTISVLSGSDLDLAWTSSGVVSCGANSQGAWSGSVPVSGSETVPALSGGIGYSYQVTCETQDGASVSSNGVIVMVQK